MVAQPAVFHLGDPQEPLGSRSARDRGASCASLSVLFSCKPLQRHGLALWMLRTTQKSQAPGCCRGLQVRPQCPLGSHDQGRAIQSGQEDASSWPWALPHLQESLSLENQGQSRGSQDQSVEASRPGRPVPRRRDAVSDIGPCRHSPRRPQEGRVLGPTGAIPSLLHTRSTFANDLAADLRSGDKARMGTGALRPTVDTDFSGALRNA